MIKKFRIWIGTETLFTTFSFTDDQAIFAQDVFNIEFMFWRLCDEYGRRGLTMNIEKTEYLALNCNANGTPIEQVVKKNFGYLITEENGTGTTEIKNRVE